MEPKFIEYGLRGNTTTIPLSDIERVASMKRIAKGKQAFFIVDSNNNVVCMIQISDSQTVLDLKKAFEAQNGPPLAEQRLTCEGQVLQDDQVLSETVASGERKITYMNRKFLRQLVNLSKALRKERTMDDQPLHKRIQGQFKKEILSILPEIVTEEIKKEIIASRYPPEGERKWC